MDSKSNAAPSSFEELSRAQAVAQLAGLAASLGLHFAAGSVPIALAVIMRFFRRERGQYTPRGNFGLANTITTARLVLVLLLAAPKSAWSPFEAAALAALILIVDGVDGAVARKRGEASAFGAHFDMETDALFVLMATERLYFCEGYGVWVLFAGILRYAYVISIWIAPGSGREAPRSLLGRLAFLVLALGLIVGLALPGRLGSACVLAGTVVVSASFARSFYFSHFAS